MHNNTTNSPSTTAKKSPAGDTPTKLIFLDCDGVVSPIGGELFASKQMNFLVQIVQQTNAKIVLSSSWRMTEFGRMEVARRLKAHGLPVFIDCTPSIPQKSRSVEILSWIEANKEKYNIVNFVALDDINLPMCAPDRAFFKRHAIVTEAMTGLTEADVAQAVQLLQDSNNIV
ncbi:hypothetical protein ERJ75_000929000 [Trypanosoma vivax]|uniref:FCP1 homology domain-containing protein n=1 Tax=Trypanosoma vivax (strain Y486) TaxID=1055687 RepID=G0U400_TRYVY|nr:hypothetical protein TRVL_02121 [Trypanosoma vivax]KAH8612080.1 hypothetical protein ERJ75_000929000 [Trypanosoma vivax]CCC52162.1 conserved hypothetical protein [Trypanosoma vivax Y486]